MHHQIQQCIVVYLLTDIFSSHPLGHVLYEFKIIETSVWPFRNTYFSHRQTCGHVAYVGWYNRQNLNYIIWSFSRTEQNFSVE